MVLITETLNEKYIEVQPTNGVIRVRGVTSEEEAENIIQSVLNQDDRLYCDWLGVVDVEKQSRNDHDN